MAAKHYDALKQILHPYVFVLKEGSLIKDDFLDYSLLMLQVTCPEILPSPDRRPQDFRSLPLMSNPFQG